jgi:hypothetical protein
MIFLRKNFFLLLSILLFLLIIIGHSLNKKSSASKKNEISNFANQLKIRNDQFAKIQKNLFQDGQDINDLVNKDKINFKKIFENEVLIDFNGYNFSKKNIDENLFDGYKFSKYSTNDILFNGNIGAVGTAFIDFYNDDKNIILATYDGIFAKAKTTSPENFIKVKSNIKQLIQYDEFYLDEHYGIKDILVDKNTLYASYIGKKEDNCFDLKIISTNLNDNFLDFKIFYQTKSCIHKNNKHGFWAHQGAGGRMVKIDSLNMLLSTGDFRNRPLAQDSNNEFGKIININIETKNSKIVSIGHRNPQGLYYSKDFDFIISTEHGPKGGDEINLNHKPLKKIKNFGWPISSYGEHYFKHYSKKILHEAPLKKSHKKYGFEEPIKYFDPSIGISQIVSLNDNDDEFLIGSMGNEIKDQDLGLHYIKLDKSRKKITKHNFIALNERVRDIITSNDKNIIIFFLETTSSIAILEKKIEKN